MLAPHVFGWLAIDGTIGIMFNVVKEMPWLVARKVDISSSGEAKIDRFDGRCRVALEGNRVNNRSMNLSTVVILMRTIDE